MNAFAAPERLLTRAVSGRYADCLRTDRATPIDVGRAKAEHDGYVAALRELGLEVEVMPADDDAPDACFVEDTVVITGDHAVATRPGAPARRGEVAIVAERLRRPGLHAKARKIDVHEMVAPATLDGGDVLRVGARLYVGLSARTNRDGVEALRHVATRDGLELVTIKVASGLHLKSACTLAGPALLLYDPAVLGEEELAPFRAAGLACERALEPTGANVLALGDAVLVSAAAPRTASRLRALGLDVRVVDVGEFHKGDGALTCLSLRVPRVGHWAT